MNTLQENTTYTVRVSGILDKEVLQFKIRTEELIGDQVEPERPKGAKGMYLYNEGERPDNTFVVYILNYAIFSSLAELTGKQIEGFHIHECTNTDGNIICWPLQLKSKKEALSIAKMWASLIGVLLASDEQDINNFKDPGKAISESGVKVEIIK